MQDIQQDISPNAAQRLRYWRKVSGITAAELARRCGVTRQCILNWEKEDRKLTADNVQLLAAKLGLTIQLFYGDITAGGGEDATR